MPRGKIPPGQKPPVTISAGVFGGVFASFYEIPTDFQGVHGAEVLVGIDSAKKPENPGNV